MKDGEWRDIRGFRVNKDLEKPKKTLKDVLDEFNIQGAFDVGARPLNEALIEARDWLTQKLIDLPIQREGLRKETLGFPTIQEAVDRWDRYIENAKDGLQIVEAEIRRLGL